MGFISQAMPLGGRESFARELCYLPPGVKESRRDSEFQPAAIIDSLRANPPEASIVDEDAKERRKQAYERNRGAGDLT